MNLRFDGRWRWAIAVAVLVGLAAGLLLPEDWNLVLRSIVVGVATGVLLLIVASIRQVNGGGT